MAVQSVEIKIPGFEETRWGMLDTVSGELLAPTLETVEQVEELLCRLGDCGHDPRGIGPALLARIAREVIADDRDD